MKQFRKLSEILHNFLSLVVPKAYLFMGDWALDFASTHF